MHVLYSRTRLLDEVGSGSDLITDESNDLHLNLRHVTVVIGSFSSSIDFKHLQPADVAIRERFYDDTVPRVR